MKIQHAILYLMFYGDDILNINIFIELPIESIRNINRFFFCLKNNIM